MYWASHTLSHSGPMTNAPATGEPVFRQLTEATRKGPAALADFYLGESRRVEDVWAFTPGLKAEIRVGGPPFPHDFLRFAPVFFDGVALYPFLGGTQRVQWLTREGLARDLARGSIAVSLPREEALRTFGDPANPLVRLGVALRDEEDHRQMLRDLAPTTATRRFWVRPRRVALVDAGVPGAPQWRLRDVESEDLREIWSPVVAGVSNPALPVRFGPVSVRETEILRLQVPFAADIPLGEVVEFLEPVRDTLARCRTALELALGEIRREGTLSSRVADGLVGVEWNRWGQELTDLVERRKVRGLETRLCSIKASLVAARFPPGSRSITVLSRGRVVGDQAEIAHQHMTEEKPIQFLWRFWGVQPLSKGPERR